MGRRPLLMVSAPIRPTTPSVSSPQKERLQTFTLFNKLPLEIRDAIWQFTFVPRIVHIKIYEGPIPMEPNWSGVLPWELSQALETACIVFTARSGLAPDSPYSFSGYQKDDFRQWTILKCMNEPVPRGPVALHVCRESRIMALKHYELCFAGHNLRPTSDVPFWTMWRSKGFGERRIWVSWRRDTIFVDEASLDFVGHCHNFSSPHSNLVLLTRYAREEIKKITKLAVCASWGPDTVSRFSCNRPIPVPKEIPQTISEFTKLEELKLYHIRPWERIFRKSQGTEEDLDMKRNDVLDVLVKAKEACESWERELPKIEVVRGRPEGYNRYKARDECEYNKDVKDETRRAQRR